MLYRLLICAFLIIPRALLAQGESHPRIYTNEATGEQFLKSIQGIEWKKSLVDKKVANLEKYLNYCKEDPNWMVSRLQMNWKTKHNEVFLNGGDFSHSSGKAPVPTVRFSGTRDWATDYKMPKLEEIEPYFDDERGFYVEHKKTGNKEWVHPSKIGHAIEGVNRNIMSLVADAAFLYWLTGDEKYAEFAMPVYVKYIDGMYHRNPPIDLTNSNQQGISGLATFEVIHEKVLLHLLTTFDFLYNFFQSKNVNLDNSIAVFQKWGDQIIKNGVPDNNWNLFQARFLTYVALALDSNSAYKNAKGKEYFLEHTFDKSTARQLSIKESLLVYDQLTGIWPECASYSVHVITTLLNIFTLLDNSTNNNELSNFPIIEKSAFASFQYLFPSGYTVGFGDSNHKPLPPENFELLISNFRKYNEIEKESIISSLLQQMIDKGEYKRKVSNLFQLFFYVDNLKPTENNKSGLKKLVSPTFYASNVSMFNQRLGDGDNAMMVSTSGSFGNHAHANGVSIELFANKYVLGPDMGKGSSYWHKDHLEYYSRFPAHNTVVVDGKSDYKAMRSYHPFKLENCFPKVDKTPTFDKLTYSKVSFFEPKTKSDQQRFTALVKSKSFKGYIVDVFRSKKQQDGTTQRHDYFYHNLGQSLKIMDTESKELNLNATIDFGSKEGDLKAYDYLINKKKIETSNDVQAIFRLKTEEDSDNLMKVWVKGSVDQSIYTALAPKSNAYKKGAGTVPANIVGDSIQTLIVKRNSAAWDNPFAMVFNPYFEGDTNPIKSVNFSSVKENPSTQIIEVTLNDAKTTDTFVLNKSEEDVIEKDGLYQKGLLSILRNTNGANDFDYFFVSGMYKYKQKDWEVIASALPITLSVERIENTFVIESDGAVLIRVPFLNGKKSAELRIYKDNQLVATRPGQINRLNPNLLEFRMSQACEKAIIVF